MLYCAGCPGKMVKDTPKGGYYTWASFKMENEQLLRGIQCRGKIQNGDYKILLGKAYE